MYVLQRDIAVPGKSNDSWFPPIPTLDPSKVYAFLPTNTGPNNYRINRDGAGDLITRALMLLWAA